MKRRKVLHFYVPASNTKEFCYNVGITGKLSSREREALDLFMKHKPTDRVFKTSQLGKGAIEIGPKPGRETSFSSNAVDLFRDAGFKKIFRMEVSRRVIVDDPATYIEKECDVCTEAVYDQPVQTFDVEPPHDPQIIVPLQGDIGLLRAANEKYKMGLDELYIQHFYRVFNELLKRDATEAELLFIKELVSEHSRHPIFNSKIVIDGVPMPHTLMQLVKQPCEIYPGNNRSKFCDNASAIIGGNATLFIPGQPGWPSSFVEKEFLLHPTLTVETHNYPTRVSPFEGADTGAGGDDRDGTDIGRGGSHLHSITGFSMGNLWLPDFVMPWEQMAPAFDQKGYASPLKIAIDAPLGAWNYQNKYGVPTLQGFFRTFGMVLPNGEHYAYWKPIMMAGITGWVMEEHVDKGEAEVGMLICRFGGPARDVGCGGGSGSSVVDVIKNILIDLSAVQRGCPGMGHLAWRVIRTLVEMGILNPMVSIHDQGAAGIVNMLTELIEKLGGNVDISQVNVADLSMTAVKILLCEYQEGHGLLINLKDLPILKHACEREGCPLEVLGEVTGSGRVVFHDSKKDITHIDLPIDQVLKGLPQKTIEDVSPANLSAPIQWPSDLTVHEAFTRVLQLPAVACKKHLVNRHDRSIMALRVVGQDCGPLYLPLNDFAMSSMDYAGTFGVATSIGEQPLKVMLDPQAGSRMTAAEMFLNMSSVKFTGVHDIKASINWMWPAKGIKGGIAKQYLAMEALTGFIVQFKTGGNGGKDSETMYVIADDGKVVKSPETLVLTGQVKVDDINKFVTVDIKKPGKSKLLLIDHSRGACRLGGSAFLQVYGQLGDKCPDVDALDLLGGISAEQEMIDQGLILSGHDRTGDGGLGICILEMLFAGDCGASINLTGNNLYATLFAEEAGKVIEYEPKNEQAILAILAKHNVCYQIIGETRQEKQFTLNYNQEEAYSYSVVDLRQLWTQFSYEKEKYNIDPDCAAEEFINCREPHHPDYHLTFTPRPTPKKIMRSKDKPKVMVLRGKVTTGDREMARVAFEAGFDPIEAHISDLKSGRYRLDQVQGLIFAPGFMSEDVGGAGKPMAMHVLFNPELNKQFTYFRLRDDTWFLGSCNGCQEGAWIGYAPFGELDFYKQPLFLKNRSGGFESRIVTLGVNKSPSILYTDMAGSRFASWSAHGEGQIWLPDESLIPWIEENKLVPLVYLDDNNQANERYPFNPNGSIKGWAGFCDPTGRFNIMMPHPIDRTFKVWHFPYLPEKYRTLKASPWLKPMQNARQWSIENR